MLIVGNYGFKVSELVLCAQRRASHHLKMREKKDGCFKKVKKRVTSHPKYVALRRKKQEVAKRITSHPVHVKFIKKRDKLAERIRVALLAFFGFCSPLCTLLCIKTSDPDVEIDENR